MRQREGKAVPVGVGGIRGANDGRGGGDKDQVTIRERVLSEACILDPALTVTDLDLLVPFRRLRRHLPRRGRLGIFFI